MKKDFDPADVVFFRESGLQQEVKEEKEKSGLAQDSEILDPVILFRAFFFQ